MKMGKSGKEQNAEGGLLQRAKWMVWWSSNARAVQLQRRNADINPPPTSPLRNVFLFPSPGFTVLNDASARLLLHLFPEKCTFSFFLRSEFPSCELASRVYDIMLLMV